MSLNLTPVSTPHEKPLPPSRSKRTLTIEARSPTALDRDRSRDHRPLRERTDDELSRVSPGELLSALRDQWNERDQLLARLTGVEEREERCMMEKSELARALQGMQDRLNSVYSEQSKLEADVETRDGPLDRLRNKLTMVESALREAQNRSASQEKAFEAERASAQAQEAHLNSRIRQLQNPSKQLVKPASSPSETLQEDLDPLRVSHHHLLSQLDTLSNELQDCRKDNDRLKEENEGWEFLVRSRTFQAHRPQRDQDTDHDVVGPLLEALDEELESEMNDLHSELNVHSPPEEDDEQSEALSRLPASGIEVRRHQTGATSRQSSISGSLNPEEAEQGMDLAAELVRADPFTPTPTLGARVNSRRDTGQEEMQKENKRLKEEVKALQLYCSKIIDRIIAQDGFEHILSVDYKTRKMGRAASGRGSLQSVMQMMHGQSADQTSGTKPVSEPAPISAVTSKPPVRPTGTLIHGLSDYLVPAPQQEQSTPTAEKSERRARRGFSLDLRSFGFGGITSSSSANEPKPALRPLTLTPGAATSTPGRKLEPQAEDEEDKRERHRLDAALRLMGIDKPQPQIQSPNCPTPVSLATPVRRSSIISSTPLSRLSSALGFSESTPAAQLPADPDPSPEKVDAALREYDAKEELRRRSLSRGQAEGGYTSPPRMASLRRHTDVEGNGNGHRASGSISSIWSRGSAGGGDVDK